MVGVHQLQRIDQWLDNAGVLHCPHNLCGQRLRGRPHAAWPGWWWHAGGQQGAHQVDEGLDLRPQRLNVMAPHVMAVRECSCCCWERAFRRKKAAQQQLGMPDTDSCCCQLAPQE